MPVIMPMAVPLSPNATPHKKPDVSGKEQSFKDLMHSALRELNENQIKADATVAGFLTGEVKDVHTVTMALVEAKLTMQLAVEVRNKVVEAYHELSRMQI